MASIQPIQWVHIVPQNVIEPENIKDQAFKSCWTMPYYEEWDMPTGTAGSIVVPVQKLLADQKIKSAIEKKLSDLNDSGH